jgi:hypothetical protein
MSVTSKFEKPNLRGVFESVWWREGGLDSDWEIQTLFSWRSRCFGVVSEEKGKRIFRQLKRNIPRTHSLPHPVIKP